LLVQKLNSISSEQSDPTLTLLNHEDSTMFRVLPDIIAKYKPQVMFNPLKTESLKAAITSWLSSIQGVADKQLKSLVRLIVSVKVIQDIQQQVAKIEKPKNWSTICKDLFLPDNVDFYKRFYQSLINERIQSIISISWSNILKELNAEVEQLIAENDRVHRDMKHYVWIDDASDNPLSLKDALSSNKQSHRLLMKVKGFTKSVVSLCNTIDGNLELLFGDLKIYLGDSEVAELRRVKEIDANHQKIIAFLRECSRDNISSLITSIKSSSVNKTPDNCIMLARLLHAISELCPNLRLCFSGHLLIMEPSFLRDPTKDDDGDREWNNICGLLEEESLRFWCMWLESFVGEWKPLEHKMDVNVMLKDFPCWDTITIQEKDESDNVVESQIHVPSQLSLSIQCWIYENISNLNRIIPHTLPKAIHLKIVEHLAVKLHEHYAALSTGEFVSGNQKAAWQCYLDLKVLSMLFVGRENKSLTEKFQQLLSHFKSIIDPFDFDVFYQHVNANIKRNATRLQHGFGCFVPNMEHLSGVLTSHGAPPSHDKDPNILMISSSATGIDWFPLLPVMTVKEPTIAPLVLEPVKKVICQSLPDF